jgi:hypothetical protein
MEMIGLDGEEENKKNPNPKKQNPTVRVHTWILDIGFWVLNNTGLTGFDSIVLCKCKHVVRCVISTLI